MRGPICGEGEAGFFGEVGLSAVAGGDGVLGIISFAFGIVRRWKGEALPSRLYSLDLNGSKLYIGETGMMTDSPNNFFTSILRERDMNNRGLPPQFDVLDGKCGGARLCSSKEIEM